MCVEVRKLTCFFSLCGVPRIKLKSPGLMAGLFLLREPASKNLIFLNASMRVFCLHHVVPSALRNPKGASNPLELQF